MSTSSGGEIVSSAKFYDALAPAYSSVSAGRMAYLDAVDDLVIRAGREIVARSYLDLGCGDGRRTLKIARALGISCVRGVDESLRMVSGASEVTIDHVGIQDMDLGGQTFDLVSALWNVLGHVPADKRAAVFEKVEAALPPNGRFIFDVNNRYNAKAYGEDTVQRNVEADRTQQKAGKVLATYNLDGRTVSTVGYVFHPTEVEHLASHCPGLKIVRKSFVDYDSGAMVSSEDSGQIVYEMSKE